MAKLLPVVGTAVGTMVGGPIGGAIGNVVGSLAGKAIGGGDEGPMRSGPVTAQPRDTSMDVDVPKPVLKPPTLMPVADGKAVEDAKRKSIIQQLAMRGRASTILTGNDNPLGG